MIANITTGTNFSGLLNYLMDGETEEGKPRWKVISGNLTSTTKREMAKEFIISRRQCPIIKNAVNHTSLRAKAHEVISDREFVKIAEFYRREMGYEKTMFAAIRHYDKCEQEIHIIQSRVGLDGSVVSDSREWERAEEVVRKIETKWGLEQVASSHESITRGPTGNELRMMQRTGEPSIKMQLQAALDAELRHTPTATELIKNLDAQGINVIPRLQSAEEVSGILFELGDKVMKGSALGKGYSWQGLQKRGLSYEREADSEAIKRAHERACLRDEQRRALKRNESADRVLEGRNIGFERADRSGPNQRAGRGLESTNRAVRTGSRQSSAEIPRGVDGFGVSSDTKDGSESRHLTQGRSRERLSDSRSYQKGAPVGASLRSSDGEEITSSTAGGREGRGVTSLYSQGRATLHDGERRESRRASAYQDGAQAGGGAREAGRIKEEMVAAGGSQETASYGGFGQDVECDKVSIPLRNDGYSNTLDLQGSGSSVSSLNGSISIYSPVESSGNPFSMEVNGSGANGFSNPVLGKAYVPELTNDGAVGSQSLLIETRPNLYGDGFAQGNGNSLASTDSLRVQCHLDETPTQSIADEIRAALSELPESPVSLTPDAVDQTIEIGAQIEEETSVVELLEIL